MAKVKVAIIESERGWGQRVDEVKTFDSLDKAKKFIDKFGLRQLWKIRLQCQHFRNAIEARHRQLKGQQQEQQARSS